MPILDCWKRSKHVLCLHNLITLLGNIVLLHAFIPMLVKTNPDLTALSYATIIGLDVAIVSQILILGLGFLYFKTCHPWARLLNAELAKRTVSEASEQRSGRFNYEQPDLTKPSESEPDLESSSVPYQLSLINDTVCIHKSAQTEPDLGRSDSKKGGVPTPLLVHPVEADNLPANVTMCTQL